MAPAVAKQNIADALARRVAEGKMPEQRAELWARSLLHDNAAAMYNLA
jgi:hypothetical protein